MPSQPVLIRAARESELPLISALEKPWQAMAKSLCGSSQRSPTGPSPG